MNKGRFVWVRGINLYIFCRMRYDVDADLCPTILLDTLYIYKDTFEVCKHTGRNNSTVHIKSKYFLALIDLGLSLTCFPGDN